MIESMLERAIEIEGLLRIIKDGNPLPETYKMLSAKATALAEYAIKLKNSAEEPSVFSFQPEPQETEVPKQTPKVEIAFLTPEEDTPDVELEEEEDPSLLRLDSSEEDQNQEVAEVPQVSDDSELSENSEVSKVPESSDAPEVSENSDDEIMLNFEFEEDSKPVEQIETPKIAKKKESTLKPAFSLNDRFLYSRELFDGNMKMFDSTLDFLEGIEEYSIIEDYFYSELEWDPENRYVASFMDILRPHFKE